MTIVGAVEDCEGKPPPSGIGQSMMRRQVDRSALRLTLDVVTNGGGIDGGAALLTRWSR